MTSSTAGDLAVGGDRAARRPFPGWRVVAGCFVVLTVSSGLGFYGLAVYLNAFSNEFDWSLSTISFATTVFFVVGGAFGLYVARLVARYDVRFVIAGGAIVGGLALASLGQVDQQWQLFVVYGIFAVGWSAAGLVPATTVVTRWFHVRRSVALSVASTGLSVGGIVITPFAKRLIDEQGLAASTPWLGLVFAAGIVPAAWLLVRPDPEADGWLPDGMPRDRATPPPPVLGTPYQRAVRTRFFWAVTIGYVFALGSQVGAIQQLVKLVEERTDASTARFAITFLAATSVGARLLGGRVVQHMPMMRFTVCLGVVQAVALVGLAVARSEVAIFASIVLFGLTIGNILMLHPLLVAERFGVLDYPRIFSRSQFITIVGTAGGPLLIGWLHDVAGTYRQPFVIAACCSLVGAAVLAGGGPATVADDE